MRPQSVSRFFALTALVGTVALAGCAPPPLALATLTIDNLSYLVSGKSLTENLLSEATNRDCSFGHMLKGEDICHDAVTEPGTRPGVALAAVEAPRQTGPRVTLDDANARPDDSGLTVASGPVELRAGSWTRSLPDDGFMRYRITDL
ncbi:MAG: hypothetical protein KDE22_01240 [Rhodobacterales bacterium]|nr:hypothetical protein [Rhodobacterales bacterium]